MTRLQSRPSGHPLQRGSRSDGLARRRPRRRRDTIWLIGPTVAIIVFFFIGPVIYNGVLALQEVTLFQAGGTGGTWVGLDNFVDLLQDQSTYAIFGNSAFWLTVVTVAARIVLGLGLALMVNAVILGSVKLRWLARSLVVVPWAVPPVVAIVLWKFLLDPRDGAINEILVGTGIVEAGIPFLQQVSTVWLGIQTIVVWRELPLVVLTILAGLQTISPEQYEAAEIDGAGWWKRLWHITLPNLRSSIAVIALLTTIWTFNNFIYVWLSTKGGPGTFTEVLGTAIYREAFVDYDVGRASALSLLATLVMAIFAVVYFVRVYQRRGEDS
ncbi:carbohydrate ABC transporter permease [Glaciibacter superstes]|uniref:carbohydrate ABC transporter permease n=1 Tax=Glaciibacter superstes TaxID=501023 RepID=UPI0003B500D3|nr:sugar ABC transporter permease [Glaciibacter superstes]